MRIEDHLYWLVREFSYLGKNSFAVFPRHAGIVDDQTIITLDHNAVGCPTIRIVN